ncbi:mitochondrial carrier [Epithele typhae]|uniref:mitochondrial carrier n=1 Tax=Epithele typhae TaxID=378194 RepID=UPI002008C84A|nr:mitochondrial carrier [Epithele typhae]KAH9943478.1 mitochondrial carrier [Epithele typhae]
MPGAAPDEHGRPSARQIFDETLSGARPHPPLPHLRSDPSPYTPVPHSLRELRTIEGAERRRARLHALWARLPPAAGGAGEGAGDDAARQVAVTRDGDLTPEGARRLEAMYADELMGRMGVLARGPFGKRVRWCEFVRYADAKEEELWHIFHDELDLDGNGHLEADELQLALEKGGIKLAPSTLTEFMTFLTSSPHSHAISFPEFRDFLLLMPRKASPQEIFRYYEVRKFMGDDGRGRHAVAQGDVTLSAEDLAVPHPPVTPFGSKDAPLATPTSLPIDHTSAEDDDDDLEYDDCEEEEHHQTWLGGSTAVKFLMAGGVAGAVSRTCTAPFDRLKIFLITRPPELGGTLSGQSPVGGLRAIAGAVTRIYAEGGVLAFWTGNGLSVLKILPESAIKFLSYESSKRMFAKYWDKVEDPRDISGVSRFLSGGIGGITSQLSIYPIETLKTQMMSSAEGQRRSLREAAGCVWKLGGVRAFYRGLAIGLVGVFPYSAIDMSTFEALKLAYLRSTGKEEPGMLALLAFGSVSGSVGATSVYPLNLVRTRLQASGSSGHPERYTGILDVVNKTYTRDGWRGFYRGLLPTLAKVVPAVSISYVVYESSKSRCARPSFFHSPC